jgi:hypothetical protein
MAFDQRRDFVSPPYLCFAKDCKDDLRNGGMCVKGDTSLAER